VSERAPREWLERTFEAVKNWSRWGADDERGALNYITPARRRAAAALIREGEVIGCAHDLAVVPAPDNPFPAQHMMLVAADDCDRPEAPGFQNSLDYVGVAYHGMATSHIDALCHVFVRGQMYNGVDASEVKSTGARRNSILAAGEGIAGRGVLLDLPRLRGVPWLEPSERIRAADLDAAERAQELRVEEGDILLVYTGRDARRAARGPWSPATEGLAGLHPECVPWLHERRIAVLGCDGVSDAFPGSGIEGWYAPVHQCCLVAMGVHLLDNLRLAPLARACDRRRRWAFFFALAPLRIPGGTGSPVNPTAIL
jgi:kynurenine formamidase